MDLPKGGRPGLPPGWAGASIPLVAVALIVGQSFGVLGGLGGPVYPVVSAGALLGTVVGIRRNRPHPAWPWWMIAAAVLLFMIGGAARQSLHTLGNLTASRSIVPDIIVIPGYLLLGVALCGLASARRPGATADTDAILDGLIAAFAALALSWLFLIQPTLAATSAPFSVRVLLATYPPLSLFLVAVTARLAFTTRGQRVTAHQYLLASMVSLLAGDVVYTLAELGVVSRHAGWIDIPYGLAFLGAAVTALHPSMNQTVVSAARPAMAPSRVRLGFITLSLGLPAIIVAFDSPVDVGDRLVLSVCILSLTVTAIWRVFRALQAHSKAEDLLVHRATHDMLTGLPNRILAQEFLSAGLQQAAATQTYAGLLFVNVDRFKLINDTLGNETGDGLLVAVAKRIRGAITAADLVARVGGDEFVVVLNGVRDAEAVMPVANRVRQVLRLPYQIGTADVLSSSSIGVAWATGLRDGVDAESLIRDADTAMYQAKAAGRDGVAVFDAGLRDSTTQRLVLERDLRRALERGELRVHYQPVVSLPDGRMVGMEALLRWTHSRYGTVSPEVFIPIAESSALIVPIGTWVLKECCRQLASWRQTEAAAAGLFVAVNVSARQLVDPGFADLVRNSLYDNRLPATALHLELTESLLLETTSNATEVLSQLRASGLKISVDDFGTGFSSLAYLSKFPVDQVKIDRSFIDGLLTEGSPEETLVVAIIAMSAALGLSVIAEGIEQPGQATRLAELGCAFGQGYLYSRGVAADAVPRVIRALSGHVSDLQVA